MPLIITARSSTRTLVAGAEGWLAWNNSDYDELEDQDPYRHHPFEMHFGVTDSTGKPKAALREMARFAALVGQLERGRLGAA